MYRHILASVIVMAAVSPAMAIDPIPQQDGWSGFLLGGVGYTDLKNNEVAGHKSIDAGKARIDSIDDSPRSDNDLHLLGTGEVSYTWAKSRTQAFLGSSVQNLLTFDFFQQLGVRREFGDLGVLQAGVLFSSIPAEVWKDPFVEGEPRKETDRNSRGIRLQWDQILGSNFETILAVRNIDIDTERSGDFLVANGDLAPSEQRLLERDGNDLQFRVIYKWLYAPGQRLEPQFIYTNHDRDGDAIAGDSYEFQLSWLLTDGRMLLSVNGVVGQRNYDEDNPVYGRKADKDILGMNVVFNYPLPWKSGRWSSTTLVSWANENSNIDFYDSSILSVMTGLTYRFGNLPQRGRLE